MKSKIWKTIEDYLYMIFAGFLIALEMQVFILPNKFVPGGFSGIASMLDFMGILPAKYGIYLFNLPLLIISVISLNKKFAIKTIVNTTSTTLFMMLFDYINFPIFTADKLVCTFLAGIIGGVAMVLAFTRNGSSGGTEIIVRLMMKKNPELDPGNLVFIFNLFIMGIGGFFTNSGVVYNLWVVVYSISLSYISGATYKLLSRGIDPALKYVIITEKPQELSKAIMEHFRRGVSMTEVIGQTYLDMTKKQKYMLMVVLQFRQASIVRRWIKEYDPDCFAFCVTVDDVVTRPSFNKKYRWKL